MSVNPPVLLLVLLACATSNTLFTATSDALSTATSDALLNATNRTNRADDGTTGWIDLCAIGCCGEGMVEVTYDAELAPTVGANKQYKFVTVGNVLFCILENIAIWIQIQPDRSLAQLYGVWDYMHELCAIYQGNLVRIESMRENNCLAKYILDQVSAN